MNLIVNKVKQLEVVHDTDRYGVIKLASGASVSKDRLTVLTNTELLEHFLDISFVCAVEYGSHNSPAEMLCGKSEVDLKNLTDIHSGRNTQRVKNDIKRSAVLKEGHILLRKNTGNNTLVSVTACHLVADRKLTLLSNVATNYLVYAGAELVAVLSCEHLNVYDDTVLTVRHTQGGVSDFLSLFTEDSTEKSFFGGKLGLSLGSNLTDENIA